MPVDVVPVPRPAPDEAPSDLLRGFAEAGRRQLVATLGDDDLADSARTMATALADESYRRKIVLVAVDDGRVVGGGWFGLPVKDNTTLVEGSLVVDPDVDATAVIGQVWAAARPAFVAQGRTTVQLWTSHAGPTGEEHLVPRTGVGRVPADRVSLVLTDLGFALEQVERHSAVEVAPALGLAAAQLPAAREAAGTAYRTFGWVGPTPQEHQSAMATLMARMSTDVPAGQLDVQPEVWDAERVAVGDRLAEAMGHTRITTVAQDAVTGELVAYTYVQVTAERPEVAYQEDTLVHADHRGHRLGMLVKALNLQRLAEHASQVARVHTWNAGENAHMLAINEALGFTERSVEGAWQLTGLR